MHPGVCSQRAIFLTSTPKPCRVNWVRNAHCLASWVCELRSPHLFFCHCCCNFACVVYRSAGKSTLLRLVMGKEQPNKGRVALGDYNIVPNYFEQNQAEALDPQMTVLDTLIQAAPDAKLNDLKQLLGRMLFSGSAMDKKVCWA